MLRIPDIKHLLVALIAMLLANGTLAGDGKLLATPGVTQFEGAGGGGLVPWASLAGYASREEIAAQTFATRVSLDDFDLLAYGAAFNFRDRLELSVARQELDVEPLDLTIRQNVLGAKLRLYGDLVYSTYPQLTAGVMHKRLLDETVPLAVGADDTTGTDFYLTATKLHLGALGGYNLLWSLTLRNTRANQTGFLGFGGDRSSGRSLRPEASVAVLLTRQLAVGLEYRQKPDELNFAREQDWKDLFVAWVPNKHFNITAAWADLGDIAGQSSQSGIYVSITGYLH